MLSKYELELVTNPDVILTKNGIIQKVIGLFGELNDQFSELAAQSLPAELRSVSAKISKGENYLGLPYVMLDSPRNFGKSGIFAIRTFFWWGNFFSVTLHLSGEYLPLYRDTVGLAIEQDLLRGWYLSAGENEWDHHFEQENYAPVQTPETIEPGKSFLKLATFISLAEWESAPGFLLNQYRLLMKILAG